jgi:hypothetical protein
MSYVTSAASFLATSATLVSGAFAITKSCKLVTKLFGDTVKRPDGFVDKGWKLTSQSFDVFVKKPAQRTFPSVFGKALEGKEALDAAKAEQDAYAAACAIVEPSYPKLIGSIAFYVVTAAVVQVVANRFGSHDLFNQRSSWLAPLSVNRGCHPLITIISNWWNAPKA